MPVSTDNAGQAISAQPRITGSVLYAPLGTTLPTSSYASLNSGFTDLGYVDESGVKTKEDRSNSDVFTWGGGLLGTLQDKYSRTLTFKLYQFLNENVLATAYGNSNLTVTAPTSQYGKEVAVKLNALTLDTLSWVFDGYYSTAAGYQALVRYVVPVGRPVQIGDVTMTNKEFMSVDITMKAFPDSNNNYGYLYVNDGIKTGGGGLGGS